MKRLLLSFLFISLSFPAFSKPCKNYGGFWTDSPNNPEEGIYIKQADCNKLKITRFMGDFETEVILDNKLRCNKSDLNMFNYCYKGNWDKNQTVLNMFFEEFRSGNCNAKINYKIGSEGLTEDSELKCPESDRRKHTRGYKKLESKAKRNISAQENIPPQKYIDKGACPFECCVYRDWTVERDTALFNKPESSTLVGKVKKGEKVQAITGEVYTTPQRLEVVFNHEKYKVGDVLYVLTYLGEGHNRIWFNGKISEEDLWFLHNAGVKYDGCQKPSNECWGRLSGKKDSAWWIEIQMKNGKKGWTKESDNFGNRDACG